MSVLAGRAELLRALGVLCEPPTPEHEALGRLLELAGSPTPAAYTGFFEMELYPYASVYLGPEGKLGGEARDRVAGFWRALALEPPAEPDHLASLLGLYASLLEREAAEAVEPAPTAAARAAETAPAETARAAATAEAPAPASSASLARGALLWEHLLSWLDPWLQRARELAPEFYAAWAARLEEALLLEADRTGPPVRAPLHLREAPPVPDPREEGGDAFVEGVLAAARSGMVLSRADLARAARRLGLGLRMGERAYALRAFVGQEPALTLEWLAAEAESAATRHAARGAEREEVAPVASWWAERARRTASLLADLAGPAAGIAGRAEP